MCTLVAALALSAHVGLAGDYNAVHPSLKCDVDATGFIAGAYLNSESSLSAYAGVKLVHEAVWLELGAVTGYEGYAVLPFVRAGVQLNDDLALFAAPAIEYGELRGAVLGLEIEF